MDFKDFWKLGFYIGKVRIETEDGEILYEGIGRRLPVKDFNAYRVTMFSMERTTIVITVESEEE